MSDGGGRTKDRKKQSEAALIRAAKGPLPTAHVLKHVKLAAYQACFDQVREVWPPGPVTYSVIAMAPLVALDALIALCPQVQPFVLARCLGLDPGAGPQLLDHHRTLPTWPNLNKRALRATLAIAE